MRVLLVSHRFLPDYLAGTEVYTGRLGHSLADRGHLVQVFTGNPAGTQARAYEWEGLVVQSVPWRAGRPADPVATFLAGFRNPPVERRFALVCSEFKPDVVHIQHLMGLSPRLPAMSRRFGARVIITLHDYWFRCSNTLLYRYSDTLCPGPGLGYHCGGCALQRLGHRPNRLAMTLAAPLFVLRTAVLRRALLAADQVIAPSQIAAQAFSSDAPLAAKLRVVPHGLTVTRSTPRAPRPGPGHPPRLVYIGSVVPPKGIHVIVRAFGSLPDNGEQLHIYGDLTADPAYVAELRALATRPGIFFHGPLPRPKVPEALESADLLLVPSLWRETYSVIADEAFDAGLPVLVAAQSAAAERVIDGVNGMVALAGDVAAWQRQLQRVCEEPGLIGRLRRGITPPRTAAQHAAAIEALYTRAAAD